MSVQFGISIKAYNNFSRTIDSFNHKISEMSKSTKDAQTRFRNFTNATSGLTSSIRNLGAVAGVAFSAFGVAVVKTGSDFEQALMGLKAMTGQTLEAVSGLGESALGMSEKFGIGASGVLDGMTRIASAKSELMEMPEALKQYADASGVLATITGENFDKAGESVVGLINIFGKSEGKLKGVNVFGEALAGINIPEYQELTPERSIDMLAKSAQKGVMRIGKLKQAISLTGSVAESSGLGFSELQGALQAVAKTGLPVSMISRQMRNIMLKMSETIPGLSDGTISFYDAMEKIKGLDLSNVQLTKWLGKQNITSFQALIKELDFAKEMTREVQMNSAGASKEMMKDITSTLQFSFKRLTQTVKNQFIKMFDPFAPMLKGVVDKMVVFVKWLGSGVASSKMFLGIVGGALAMITASLGTLGVMLTAGTFALWAQTAIPAILAVGSAFHASTGGIFLIIPAIVAGIGLLIGAMSFFRSDSEKPFFEVLMGDLTELFGFAKSIFGTMTGWIFDLFNSFDVGGDAIKAWGTFLKGIAIVLTFVLSTLISISTIIVMGVVTAFKLVYKYVNMVYTRMSDLFEIFWGFKPIEIFDKKGLDVVWKKLSRILEAIKKTFGLVAPSAGAVLNATGSEKKKEEVSPLNIASDGTWDAVIDTFKKMATENQIINNLVVQLATDANGNTKVLNTEGKNIKVKTEDTGASQMSDPTGE